MAKASDPPVRPQAGTRTNKPRRGDAAFDEWLNRGLHEMYDNVVAEPLSEELLKLIEEDRNR